MKDYEVDFKNTRSALIEKRTIIANTDPVFAEVAAELVPLTENKITIEETRHFLLMQIDFIHEYKDSELPQTELEALYKVKFDEAIEDIAEGRTSYYKERRAEMPENLRESVIAQFQLFEVQPLTRDANAEDLVLHLETECARLNNTVAVVMDEMEPLADMHASRSSALGIETKEAITALDREYAESTHPLEKVCREGNYQGLIDTLEVYDPDDIKTLINTPTENEEHVLAIACENGHLEIVQKLLELGADVHAINWRGYTAMHEAMKLVDPKKDIMEILALLVEYGADINVKTPGEARTPLACAAYQGNLTAAVWLLKQKADVNAQESARAAKCTSLHWAVVQGHIAVVDMLLNTNANSSLMNDAGETPLMTAMIKYCEEKDEQKRQDAFDVIKVFLDARVSLSRNDWTSLRSFEAKHVLESSISDVKAAMQRYIDGEEDVHANLNSMLTSSTSQSSRYGTQLALSVGFNQIMQADAPSAEHTPPMTCTSSGSSGFQPT